MERGTMRKSAAIMALLALFTLVAAGVAIAVTKTCSSVPCRGTPSADLLKERLGNGKRDVIIGGRGNDRLRAGRFGADADNLDGGRGNDRLDVLDRDIRDRAVGGPGKRDVCIVDDLPEVSPSCDIFGIP
jgi:hypothetical protein